MAKASRSDIIKFRISYDAEKLSKKLPDMISDFVNDYSQKTSEGSINKIKSNKVLPSTSDKFKKVRKSQGFPTTPTLLMTGKLVDSIKTVKFKNHAKLKMKKYGWYHHTGKGNNKERPFIEITKRELGKLFTRFKKDLKKNFKKKGK